MKKRTTPASKFAFVKETVAYLEDSRYPANAAATRLQAPADTTSQSTVYCTEFNQ